MEVSLLKAVLMFVAGPLLIAVGLYFSIRTEAGRRRAVKTTAIVLDSEVYWDNGSWYPHIRYRYLVAGREYTSTQVHPPPGRVGGMKLWVRTLIKQNPSGRHATAYRDPDDPARPFSLIDANGCGLSRSVWAYS